MDSTRVVHVAELGGLRLDGAVDVVGADPVLPTPSPVGEIAAVALAHAGVAAARLSRRAGASPGPVRVAVADAAAATIGFAVMRVDGESMARTNAENPWVGRYRCADGRWIHLHGGFPALADRLASNTTSEPNNATTMSSHVTRFELHTADTAPAKEFYGSVLGWTFDDSMPGYTMIRTSDDAPIGGGLVDTEVPTRTTRSS